MATRTGLEPVFSAVTVRCDSQNFTNEPYVIFGSQGGTRTHKILILSQARMPIPSPGHVPQMQQRKEKTRLKEV